MKSNRAVLLEHFNQFPYFTHDQASQFVEMKTSSITTLLYRMCLQGDVIKLKQGVYQTKTFYETHVSEYEYLPAMASLIRPTSYISTIFVLQRAGVLTDVTYPITAITSEASRRYTNSIGTFTYQHIQPALYTGYTLQSYHDIIYGLASRAKALFDFLYLRPLHRALRTSDYDLVEELRLNLFDWTAAERSEFARYVDLSQSQKMTYILRTLQRTVWQIS